MDQSTQRRLVEVAARYNFILLLFGVSIRPFIVPTHWSYFVLAAVDLLVYGGVYYLIRLEKLGKYAALALFASTFFCLIPVLSISGGINSHLIYLLPVAPVFAGLILPKKTSWIPTAFTCFLIVALWLFVRSPGEMAMSDGTLPKMVWLILSTLMAGGFAQVFAKESRLLANTLKHEAHIDYLTRVLNRRGIEHLLNREINLVKKYGGSICLMMLDLDHFKRYNDCNGHVAGDLCLSKISERLSDVIKAEGGFIGRYGGEEFIAVFSGHDPVLVDVFARSINSAVRDMTIPLKKGHPEILTISIGYCYREPKDIVDGETMISCADAKLYECKDKGRDLVKGDVVLGSVSQVLN